MVLTAPRMRDVTVLDKLHDDCPGCEIHPFPDSDECCGSPAVAKALFETLHAPGCGYADSSRFTAWTCSVHLDRARRDELSCHGCGSFLVLVNVL